MLARSQDEGTVDPVLARLVDDPLGGPRRIVQVLVEACCPAGQCGHRIVEAVADVAVGAEREVHRPDEDGAVRRLERGVEAGVVPQARADPHQSRTFARACRDACVHALLHFVVEGARVGERPLAAPHPLRRHHVGDLLRHPHRALRRGGNQAAHVVEHFFLLIDQSRVAHAGPRDRDARPLITSRRSTRVSSVETTNASRCGSTSSRHWCRPSSHQRGGRSPAPG